MLKRLANKKEIRKKKLQHNKRSKLNKAFIFDHFNASSREVDKRREDKEGRKKERKNRK